LTPSSLQIFQFFKYAVYALLTLNIFLFFNIEWAGAAVRFADGVELADIIEGFVATIDTAAWVVLLLMFELETYVLEDKHFTRRVSISLHALRAICYAFILYSFYGYLIKLIYILGATPLIGVSDLCTLVADNWSYAIDLDEYVLLTSDNCASMSSATNFLQYSGLSAAVDQAGWTEISRLAWVDVINSAVWLLIVIVLEIDVRLQEHGRLNGLALRLSRVSKFILYPMLLLAAIYWGIKGDFVDFWDAFLWLVAFVFIELNVFEWRQESLAETPGTTSPG
jgi:uncharacterized protein with PQ loop repeat